MSDEVEEFSFEGMPEVWCRHLLLCRSAWFDHRQPERGFSLGGVYVQVPTPDDGFPVVLDRPFVYFQLFGSPGEYTPRIRVVRVDKTGYDEEEELQLGEDGEPLEYPMPSGRPAVVDELSFVEQVAYRLDHLVFPEKGVYEFQLWLDGFDQPAGRERIKIGEN